ncbi:MAG: hypothetical protein R3Y63_04445 [Eubacteriales bacterium]
MIPWENYIVAGKVKRNTIAMDIKKRKLTAKDIPELVSHPEIKASFIGTSFSEKTDPSHWTEEYLETLIYAVVAESFNEDYLLYLDQVAEKVSGKSIQKSAIGTLGLFAGVIVILFLISKFMK